MPIITISDPHFNWSFKPEGKKKGKKDELNVEEVGSRK